jgi:hypothetical protein
MLARAYIGERGRARANFSTIFSVKIFYLFEMFVMFARA